MTTINGSSPPPVSGQNQLQKASVEGRKRLPEAVTVDSAESIPAALADQLTMSPEMEAAMAPADFDSQKVQRLRDAIASGAYPIDPMKISEKFLELERLL
jgi:flagellar biosynthesis anti-sigma factor FlgM